MTKCWFLELFVWVGIEIARNFDYSGSDSFFSDSMYFLETRKTKKNELLNWNVK